MNLEPFQTEQKYIIIVCPLYFAVEVMFFIFLCYKLMMITIFQLLSLVFLILYRPCIEENPILYLKNVVSSDYVHFQRETTFLNFLPLNLTQKVII